MKKTIAAAILLALLFGAAAWNIAHIDALTGSLTALAEDALESCRAEDYDAAEKTLRQAIDLWYGAENYTHPYSGFSPMKTIVDFIYDELPHGELPAPAAEAPAE